MRNKKLDGMLLATFLTTIFYASTYPFIHKQIVSVASDTLIALNQIVNCISVVFFGSLWNKYSNRLFKYYPLICIAETLLSFWSTLFAICSQNIIAYYIMDTLIFVIVTRNICCGNVRLKAIRYKTESAREQFDNNNNSADAIATIIGSIAAIWLHLDFNTMLVIATIGNTIDNIFYILIYLHTNKEIKNEF